MTQTPLVLFDHINGIFWKMPPQLPPPPLPKPDKPDHHSKPENPENPEEKR